MKAGLLQKEDYAEQLEKIDYPAGASPEDIYVTNSKKRTFKAWLTAESIDTAGEEIPIENFKASMSSYMSRGAPMTMAHSNYIIGKLLNYTFTTHPETGTEGCLVEGQIFDDNYYDHEAWKILKNNGGLSVGGTKVDALSENGTIRGLQIYEIAVTPKPANKYAKVVAISKVAKSALTRPDIIEIGGKKYIELQMERLYKEDKKDGDNMPEDEKKTPPKEEVAKEEMEKPKKEIKKETPPTEPDKKTEVVEKEMPPEATATPEVAAKEGPDMSAMASDLAEIKAMLAKILEMSAAAEPATETTPVEEACKKQMSEDPAPAKTEEKRLEKQEMPKKEDKKDESVSDVKKSLASINDMRPEASSPYAPKNPEEDMAAKIAKGESEFDINALRPKRRGNVN